MGSPRILVVTLRPRWPILIGALSLLFLGWALLRQGAAPAVIPPVEVLLGKRIVIDPGHGGVDPGAVGIRGTLEKDVVLSIAKLLDPLLRRASAETLLLRESDRELASDGGEYGTRQRHELALRVNEANAFSADVYISLHANSFPSPKWSGAQTFYDPGDHASVELALAVQERLVKAFPENSRRARPGEYYVLRHTEMPAIVVEVGFLSNPREEELLADPDHQRALAEAIFLGVADFFAGRAKEEAADLESSQGEAALSAETAARPDPGSFLLYFQPESNGVDGLVPVSERFPENLVGAGVEERLAYALRRLADGPSRGGSLLPTMPPGTKVLSVALEGRRVEIDLSREVASRFWGGGRSEELLLESLLMTAAQFPGVEEVAISVENERARTLAGHVDLAEPFPVPASVR